MDEILRRAQRQFRSQPDDLQAALAYIAALERSISIAESPYEILNVLILSTIHIPEHEDTWLWANPDWVWANYEGGWMLWVAPQEYMEERISHYPENIGKLMVLARNLGCDYLRLDRDGPEQDNLPQWEW